MRKCAANETARKVSTVLSIHLLENTFDRKRISANPTSNSKTQ